MKHKHVWSKEVIVHANRVETEFVSTCACGAEKHVVRRHYMLSNFRPAATTWWIVAADGIVERSGVAVR